MSRKELGAYINSGSMGINITHNQDTAVPFPYPDLIVGKRHCRVLAYHSGVTGIDIRACRPRQLPGDKAGSSS